MEHSIEREIHNARNYLSTLNSNVTSKQDVLAWFQRLCVNLCDLLHEIAKSIRNNVVPTDKHAKDTILLYLLQLNTSLSMLIKVFTTEHEIGIVIKESRFSILQQVRMCLTGLENVLMSNTHTSDPSMGFVKYMDLVLDKMSEIDIERGHDVAWKSIKDAQQVIEHVLCHAMSIGQVALKEDCNVIKGSSKEVLHHVDYLVQELQRSLPRISMCHLFVDAVCDKLCALERKVNASVLKLALKVFSECAKPLEDLHQFCLRGRQDEAALDEAVADFDMHVDRIIQVGLFAVSCSADRNCALRMRSCLASLEALEGELVPALTALLRDGSAQTLYHADLLKQYWLSQAAALKKHIYLIIDPLAFCQITHEVIRDINFDLEERLRDATALDRSHVKPITLQTKILYEMLLVSLVDSPVENQHVVKKYLDDVISVTMEIDAAADRLLREDEMCKENVFRVFKRCKVQENILRRLLDALGHSQDPHLPPAGAQPMSPDNQSSRAAMDHITTRGMQILKDRSVLYKTFGNGTPLDAQYSAVTGKPLAQDKLSRLRNVRFSHSRSIMEASTCDLQITDILSNLTALSQSLRTT